MSDLAPHIAIIARAVWGDENKRLSKPGVELRFGTNGSKSVDLRKGVWADHEASQGTPEAGGGVLDLLRVHRGLSNGAAFEFMRGLGIDIPKPEAKAVEAPGRIVATYDYVSEDGELLFQVCRLEPKTFRQRRPEGDGWSWSVKGLVPVPYRLPEVIEAIAQGRTVTIVEGEKAVDHLWSQGIPATCNPMGAGKWPTDFSRYFAGADVAVVRDNDSAGHKHGVAVAENLQPVANTVRIVDPPGNPEKAGLDDWMAANKAGPDAVYAMFDAHGYAPGQEPFKSGFRALWLHEIACREVKLEWLVKGVLPARGFGGIVGQPGCGKSFLALDLAFSVSVLALDPEARWFGHRVKQAGVIYIAAEGQDDFLNRVQALLQQHKVKPSPNLPFVLVPTSVDLRSPEGDTGKLIEEIKAHAKRMNAPLGLIVVDTLNRVMAGGDENASEDMGALIRNLGKVQEATGAAVVAVHHKNADGNKARGHTSFQGALDFRLDVEKSEGGGNSWSVQKMKCGPEGASYGFRLEQVKLGQDEDGDAITTCLVDRVEQRNDAAMGAGTKLPPSAEVAYRLLVDCCNDMGRGVPIDGLQKYRGVTIHQWRDACKLNHLVPPGSPDNTFFTTFRRATDALKVRRLIGASGDWVWPLRDQRGPTP